MLKIQQIRDNDGNPYDIFTIENFRIDHRCPFCHSTYHYKFFWGLLRHVENIHIPGGICYQHKGCKEKKRKTIKILLDYINDNPSVKWKETDLNDRWLEKVL